MRTGPILLLGLSLGVCVPLGCMTAPRTEAARKRLERDAETTIERFKATDPSLDEFFGRAAGYVVFPSVGKGGWMIAGGYGRGVLYERDQGSIVPAGYADVTMGTIGPQIGAQSYSQIVFLDDSYALDRFKYGKLKFAASLSAVAATAGAAKSAAYADHVAVFTMSHGGLMAECAVGGQSFGYWPK